MVSSVNMKKEIGDILGKPSFIKDVTTHHIGTDICGMCGTPLQGDVCPRCIPPELDDGLFIQEPLILPKEVPTNVNNMCAALVKQWTETADLCDERADALERVVSEFRRRAVSLRNACNIIPTEIRDNVLLEMESQERAMYVSSINPVES